MIIIGEKINGSIPSIGQAIEAKDAELIRRRVISQVNAGADFIDCAAGTEAALENDAIRWLINIIQETTETPICIDSPNAALLASLIEAGVVSHPGMVNSVSMEGNKCDLILPLIAGGEWSVIGLTCDDDGIPAEPEKRVDIAKRIIERADKAGVAADKLLIDPCVMSMAVVPSSLNDFVYCVRAIHEFAPGVKVVGALSNVSYGMPARKFVNMSFMTSVIEAGLDSAIMDPTNENMLGVMFAASALKGDDKGGRKYNRAFRKGLFGAKK